MKLRVFKYLPTFGSPMPTRCWSDPNAKYKYGFNGKEKDNEVNVDGGDYDFGARIYDSRLGRWLSLDPLQKKYPNFSPYIFAANNSILFYDPSGKEIIIYYKNENGENTSYTYSSDITCTPPNNKFVQNVINSLNAMANGSQLAKTVISHMENNGITNVYNSDVSGHAQFFVGNIVGMNDNDLHQKNYDPYATIKGYPNEYGDTYNALVWDDLMGGITNSTTGCTMRPPASKLFHELVHSYFNQLANEALAEYNALSPADKKADKGIMLINKADMYGKMMHNEELIISDYENKVSEDMGWGTRHPADGEDAHKVGQPGAYQTNNPLSQSGTSCSDNAKDKTSIERTDNKNSPCEH